MINQPKPSPQTSIETVDTSDWAVRLEGVSKTYRHFALQQVTWGIPRGSVAGLIGPNGAGKSTTMRLLMGFVKPNSGEVSVLGQSLATAGAELKHDIGYFSDDLRLYPQESLNWHMQFVKSLFPNWDERYAQELLQKFHLTGAQKIKGLSHGQRVKAQLLLILARRPQLLILDEPTDGLDPVAKQEILGELMKVVEDERRTLIYSSHNTVDIEQICDSITFIDRGRVVASHNCQDFLDRWRRIKIQAADTWSLPSNSGWHLETSFRGLRVLTHDHFTEACLNELQTEGVTIESLESMTLEEIFVSAVQRDRTGVSS
jgi:ABC-2 type transport system ATP-binding protein